MELAREMEQRQLAAVGRLSPSPLPPAAAAAAAAAAVLSAPLPAANRAELIKRQLLESDEAPESKV